MTHWKKLTNPDYLGAYAIEPGQEPILTIKEVRREMVTGADGKKEECTVAHFTNNGVKPMILNSTNCKSIQKAHGTPHIEDWQGKLIQLYVTPVKAFGEEVDALRIRPIAPKPPQAKKEVMTPESNRWAGAVKSLADGTVTIDVIESKFTISADHKKQIIDESTKLALQLINNTNNA